MVKNIKKDNTLIKKKNLILELKKLGIKRVSPEAIIFLEKYLEKNLLNLSVNLKEELIVNGRKTLFKQDIENVLKNMQKKENSMEI